MPSSITCAKCGANTEKSFKTYLEIPVAKHLEQFMPDSVYETDTVFTNNATGKSYREYEFSICAKCAYLQACYAALVNFLLTAVPTAAAGIYLGVKGAELAGIRRILVLTIVLYFGLRAMRSLATVLTSLVSYLQHKEVGYADAINVFTALKKPTTFSAKLTGTVQLPFIGPETLQKKLEETAVDKSEKKPENKYEMLDEHDEELIDEEFDILDDSVGKIDNGEQSDDSDIFSYFDDDDEEIEDATKL